MVVFRIIQWTDAKVNWGPESALLIASESLAVQQNCLCYILHGATPSLIALLTRTVVCDYSEYSLKTITQTGSTSTADDSKSACCNAAGGSYVL
uniref:Uncharacterized protein n=1 Tax=Romanomermis culicivorax TaxID=13658 RepID=A0A915L7A4_ROMCU